MGKTNTEKQWCGQEKMNTAKSKTNGGDRISRILLLCLKFGYKPLASTIQQAELPILNKKRFYLGLYQL